MAKTKRKATNSPAKSPTKPQATTSKITPPATEDPNLEVVGIMPATLKLFGWVQGDASDEAFKVIITDDKDVTDLKKAIQLENLSVFRDVDAHKMKIWKVSVP
jgi:hypothetical protein